jgi:hypothetical protein
MAHSLRKSRLSATLDWGVATLACASAGFLLIAMPDDLFSGLVIRSGLPNLVAAAQPPLGGTARLAAAAAAALFAFAFVLSLLRALERAPAAAAAEADPAPDRLEGDESDPAMEAELPRLRKADAHPDAPARRPILAGRELGEPVQEPEAREDELLLEADLAEPAADPAPAPAPLPAFLVPQDAPLDPPAEAFREPEPAPRAEMAAEPAAPVEVEAEAEPEPEGEDELHPRSASELSALMERFESGLSRKQQAIVRPVFQAEPVAPAVESAPAVEEPADRVGHRLRSAIAELQKVAGQAR